VSDVAVPASTESCYLLCSGQGCAQSADVFGIFGNEDVRLQTAFHSFDEAGVEGHAADQGDVFSKPTFLIIEMIRLAIASITALAMSSRGVLAWISVTTSDSANTAHWAFI